MRCGACGHGNRETAAYCEACGSRLAQRCSRCAAELRPGARFCDSCGQAQAASSSSAATPTSTPRSYTPRHLAEKILAGRAGLEGERKQVTVLFADVKGSTELIQGLDTELAQRLLDGAVQVMMAAVHRFEGTVSRVMGDGIMALFGAPLAHEDHAVRACYAALALQDGMRRYAEQLRRQEGIGIEARVGLNSGEVIVRLVSDDLHMDYTAMGQTVHLASRMEQLASGGTTALASETLRLVEGYVQVRSLGPVPIKGLAEPVEVFDLLGTGPARTRLQAAAARGLTRFVGRQTELEALHTALAQAGGGHGQIAALVGEPGVGKSRLVWEVTHSYRTQDWLVLESGSVSYGKATSYLPVIDLLKSYCRIETRDEPRTVREKVTGKLLTLDRALEPTLPALLALLDVLPAGPPPLPLPLAGGGVGEGVSSAAWAALDPAQRRRQTLDAVKRLLLRESQEQPLLLVFEDLHWIDAETQALLDSLAESLPTARILLLVNYRPEYRHGWGSRAFYAQIRVNPLEQESADDLLSALVGEDDRLGPLKRLLVERTEGNPFFLEESVRSLVETGALAGERGAYRPVADLSTIRVPAAVQAVLAARVDRLPPEEKRLLQTASVIGKDVPDAILRAVTADSEGSLQRGLAALQAAEFLYEASLFPELEYTFKHALTHEVAYGSLLQDRKRDLHARIVDAIERVYDGRLDEHVERLAYHAVRGEAWAKAATYSHQAGVKAFERSAGHEAVSAFEQALAALKHLPESRATIEQAIDVRLLLSGTYSPLGEFERVMEPLPEAIALAETLGDQARLGHALSTLAMAFTVRTEHDKAVEVGERALAIARAVDNIPEQIRARFYLGLSRRQRADYRQAIDDFRWIAATIRGDMLREGYGLTGTPAIPARSMLGECLAELGEFVEARAYGEEATALAESLGVLFGLAQSHVRFGDLCLRQGRPREAIPRLERGRHFLEQGGIGNFVPRVTLLLGIAHLLDGRPVDGKPLLERGRALLANVRVIHGTTAVPLVEGYMLEGRLEEAATWAQRVLADARKHREPGYEAHILRLLGEIALRRDPPDLQEAERRFRESLSLAERLGMRPLQAHCYLGLGTLYPQAGRYDEARVALSTAIDLLRDMEMTFWLPAAEAALAELSRTEGR